MEIIFLIKKKKENGGRTINNNVFAGDVALFPQGLIHSETNNACEPAQFVAATGSEDPGVLTAVNRMFTMPNDVLINTFNISQKTIDKLKSSLPVTPAFKSKYDAECVERCKKLKKQ